MPVLEGWQWAALYAVVALALYWQLVFWGLDETVFDGGEMPPAGLVAALWPLALGMCAIIYPLLWVGRSAKWARRLANEGKEGEQDG